MVTETFETCYDDDQVEIIDWIFEQLRRNTDGFYKIKITIEENLDDED